MSRTLPGLSFAVLLAAGCSSYDGRLYEEGEPPRLKDGAVTMITYWNPGDEARREERVVRATGGAVTCRHRSPSRGVWEGEVPEDEWVDLWQALFADEVFGGSLLAVEPDDLTAGSPYHLVKLHLGTQVAQFSSQNRADLLIFSSKAVQDRLAHTNRIVALVGAHATRQVSGPYEPEAPAAPSERGATPPGPRDETRAGGESGRL